MVLGVETPRSSPSRRARRTAAWLVEAVAPGRALDSWERDGRGVPADLCEAAVVHGVEGWVLRRARAAGLELPPLADAVRGAMSRHLRAMSDLRATHASLGAAGVPYLVVKGPALVERLYAAPDLRSYVDLDLLVRPADLEAAVRALEGSGFRLLDANWPLLQQASVRELRLVSATGGAVDLHWSLAKGPHATDTSPRVDSLLARAEVWRSQQAEHRVLGWADTVVHLAVHAAASGGHRLLWCADLRAAVEAAPDGATADLLSRASEWSAGPQLHLMLSRMRSVLGTPVPDEWLEGLGVPAAWTRFASGVDRVFPVSRHAGGRGPTRLVARSASATARESWRALGSKALTAARSPRERLDPEWLLDPAEPRSALHPVGGAEGRRRFFAQVTEEARAAGR